MAERTDLRAVKEGTIVLAKGTPHEVRIPCAILNNGWRVITASGVSGAYGRERQYAREEHGEAASQLPRFLAAGNVKSALDKELGPAPQVALEFVSLRGGGRAGNIAYGFRAGFLTMSSRAVLAARRENTKGPLRWRASQEPLAHAAERLLGALAETGEVALIDEACGVLPEPDAYARVATDAGAAEALADVRQQLVALSTEFGTMSTALARVEQSAIQAAQTAAAQVGARILTEVRGELADMRISIEALSSGLIGERIAAEKIRKVIRKIALYEGMGYEEEFAHFRKTVEERVRKLVSWSGPWARLPRDKLGIVQGVLATLEDAAQRDALARNALRQTDLPLKKKAS